MRKSLATLSILFLSGITAAATESHPAQSPDSILLLMAILTPFAASLIISLFYSKLKDYSAYLGAFSGLISLFAVLQMSGKTGVVSYSWIPSLRVSLEFYVDGFSIMLALLASGIGVLVFLYSRAYMSHGEWKRKYYTVLTAFMGSMIGLVFSSNLVLMFLFWEFTSICSFLLISHNQRTDSGIYASKKSLLITVGSGIMLLTGFLIINSVTGTFSMAEILSRGSIVESLKASSLYVPVIFFIGIGAAAKSAQVPLHIWLPDAMEAPTPVSAFLHSATMVKAGVFLLGRFRPVLIQGELWSYFLISLGLLTMTVAALLAVASKELKELLAYSTASHLGLIVVGLGVPGVLGAETASFHVFNHAIFKASLFMVAGVILHEAGTQKISDLSGLRSHWPVLSVVGTVSALSMSGIPFLNGFYSKELLFESTYNLAASAGGLTWILPVVAVTGSVFTFVYSFRFISVFYGEKTELEIHSAPNLMLLAPGVLATLAILVGLLPNYFIDKIVLKALHGVSTGVHGMSVHVVPHVTPAFLMSVVTMFSGLLLFRKSGNIHMKLNNILEHRLLNANFYYHRLLDLLDASSSFMVKMVESSLLRTYVAWVLLVASLSAVTGYLISGYVPLQFFSMRLPIMVVLATSVASVYAVVRSNTYISSVLTLSILGFMVSIFYLLMDAPDLVMTQLVVESLSLIIFLLVLNSIPDYTKKITFSRKFRDILISAGSGLMVFTSVIYATAEETPVKLAKYYLDNALPGSGGTNVVNVILVDFRGLDTMGEISVIFMAGMAILMLFRMRGEEK